ncbi:uncharacterized protein PG998_009036 [Apiospora kogelbergensis]|uniref:uncharacterized protein n=1 Tax=Apiospora kogelbergensis TaxID=1337665 RepID=UPI00312EB691
MQFNTLHFMPLAASVASAACVALNHASPAARPASPAVPVVAAAPATASAPAAVVASPGQQQAVAVPATQRQQQSSAAGVSGTSTFYGGNLNGGTCSFSSYTLPAGIYGTAFSGSAWDNSAKCGSCLEVTAKGKTIKVMLTSPQRSSTSALSVTRGHLDLFENAWKALSPDSSDPMTTSWTEVECGITSPLVLHNKSGTSPYWFSMQVINANEAVAKLEVSTDGGKTWQGTKRQDYNFFENPSGFGASTMTIRVTGASGKTVTVENVGVESDSQIKAASNF